MGLLSNIGIAYIIRSTPRLRAKVRKRGLGGLTGRSNTAGAEVALDFMFWPKKKWGWFLEPAYGVDFASGHAKSISLSFGMLFGVD